VQRCRENGEAEQKRFAFRDLNVFKNQTYVAATVAAEIEIGNKGNRRYANLITLLYIRLTLIGW
jgi:hypothetical protein